MKWVVIGAHLRREDVEPIANVIPIGNLVLSALSVDDDRPLGDRDLLMQIADVRAKLLDRATFVAIRYGFAVRDAAEAARKCGALAEGWRALIEQHRDEVEMTLKIATAAPAARPDRHSFSSGAEYLRALHSSAQSTDVDPKFRDGVERALVPLTSQHRWIHRDRSSMELAMLVRRGDL